MTKIMIDLVLVRSLDDKKFTKLLSKRKNMIFCYLQMTELQLTSLKVTASQIRTSNSSHQNALCTHFEIEVHILIHFMYRVTHKGLDFRDDCTEFALSAFLHCIIPCRPNSVLNHSVNHQNTQLNAETKNKASNRHIFRVLGCPLQYHPLWVTVQILYS